jgi:uncharacterized protein YcfJ
MNKTPMILSAALLGACGVAHATEYGTVISSTPVVGQVAVPQQQCYDEQQMVQQRNGGGGGALVGALIGGVIGNQFGTGMGKAAATGLGVVAGAALGDQAEAANSPPATTVVRRCQNVSRYENRPMGYDVVYEYNGQRYSTRMAQDPGARIALDVTVAPAGGGAPVGPPSSLPPPVYSPNSQAPVYAPAQPVVYAPAPVYYPAPAYYYGASPVVVVPRVVIGVGGYWHRGYWH